MTKRLTTADFPGEVLELFDRLVHGRIDRRQFLDRAARFTTAGVTAAAMLESLSPRYALAEQVAPGDPRITTSRETVRSPDGHGEVAGLLAMPAGVGGSYPAVLVIHENRGLNPYIEYVARRLAVAGFLAYAPDGLTSLGGYPGTDDEGRSMQRKLDRDRMEADFVASARWLDEHPRGTGKVGVVGFCFGGGMANLLAVRIPDVIDAAVPFYGRQAPLDEVANLRAPLLLQYAENDQRVNEGWPAYEEALTAAGKEFNAVFYPDTHHGFHNDTTPRYHEEAAALAWERTVNFFREHLAG